MMMTREELLLRDVWNSNFEVLGWDQAFVVDESLPSCVADQIDPQDVAVVLDCWRGKMVEAVDEVARRYKEKANSR